MKMPIPFLKPFEVLATDLTDKYRFNPFFQSTVHIITLQVILAILLIGITGTAIEYAQTNTVGSIRYHIQMAGHASAGIEAATLPAAIANVRTHTLVYVFIGLIILIAVFALLLIKFALAPAKNSVQFQKRFIGNVAHEIRTPLAIIKTSTEVALMDPKVSEDMRSTLKDTISELDRISETINNLLSFDNLIRPERLKTMPIDLGAIAEVVVQRHHQLSLSRGVSLSLITPPKKRLLRGNAVAIEEVMTNLVKNAINYTPANAGGKVTVRIDNEFNDRISLTVSDTGIGIAQKDLMHVFEPFYRGDTSRARNIGTGTSGLGLAIVNEIARMHHGTTSVRSTVGQGTSIKISFPAAKASDLKEFDMPFEDANDSTPEIQEVSMDFS